MKLTKMSISVCGDNFEDSVVDGQEGNVEGSTAQVEDENVLLALLLVHAVSDGGGGRLVDDSHHDQTGNDAGIFGSLTLSVVEILKNKINLTTVLN